ncbi:hypothetical protein [Verrucomicrobium sp. BvORR106]|uniref:hypothetical protein n=1 Tax=Verrucomicrobium sp. BvORR106 TaxID=1403819 RepID=UPI0005720A60|nr:hypothetical protein [Verrucomicrobium sp. BvORR106]
MLHTDSPNPDAPVAPPIRRRWLGSGALIAAGLFILGRLAAEPFRTLGHYDGRAMEAFAAVEHYGLRKKAVDPQVAFFGSSQTFWGLVPEVVGRASGHDPKELRVLGVEAGTPFDMWNLIRRNPEYFDDLKLAVVEVNPVMMQAVKEGDPRLQHSISQYATLEERNLLHYRHERMKQQAEWLLPLTSARHSLRSVFLALADPVEGAELYPFPEGRIHPAADWYMQNAGAVTKRSMVPAEVAARRLVGSKGWKASALQDLCLKKVLAWMEEHEIPVLIHQFPLHPEVVDLIRSDTQFHHCYTQYSAYVETLRPKAAGMVRLLHPDECGAGKSGMADRMHLNESGASYYSLHLGENIRTLMDPVTADKVRDDL